MRKVTTINLNNNAYQIDEEGYDALRAYLEEAARALTGNPDREEILADLEQAIADKCRLALGPHKSVVSEADIRRILDEMGPVEGAEKTEPSASTADSSANSEAEPAAGAPHRMYRIYDGAVWSGVCTGLAAYIGVDVVFVRLAFILLTIASVGLGFLVYILMIVLVPKAGTPAEISAAHGQPFRAQEVVDRVKKKHDDWRSDRRDQRRMRREQRRAQRHAWWSAQPPAPPQGYTARITGGVLLPVLTVLSAVWFAAMAIAAYAAWHFWPEFQARGWSHHGWHEYSTAPHWVALIAIIAVYALLAIPLGSARRAALYYTNGGRHHGWADAWSGLLWAALVAVLLLAAWFAMPQLQEMLQETLRHGSAVVHV